ncbi:sulfite exporter TauE/SafE family protein [uncultured Chitinophaga sp.]|uniref:sulfite exporter TauE/SafE family protein n=1 Tax=uncultured Chitinophaga sp. TaxID=339340 RepID=UPI0026360429|nr:sulfite exporter TauE/SafE family protein [uncultured Chitinophaga sp.]
MWPLILSAFSLGFLGSFHCIGMCGPIALALPVQHLQGVRRLGGILLYNAGRMTTYALLGLVFGWLGRQFYLGGLQQWLSIVLGALLLLMALLRYLPGRRLGMGTYLGQLTAGTRRWLGVLLQRQGFTTLYAIGLLNGLLPCGLVYLGIAGALATVHIYQGGLFMAVFGAGTIPAMAALSASRQFIGLQARNRIKQLIPVVIALMGVLLIIRGMNLGIPYVSPSISPYSTRVMERCHF